MYDVIIVGAGGLGREVCEMAEDIYADSDEYRVKGFLSDVLDVLDGHETSVPLLGTIQDYVVQPNDRFLMGIGDVAGKKKIAELLMARGAEFLSIVHPRALVFRTAKFGKGVVIYPFAHIGSDANIGDFCLVNVHAAVGHDVQLGNYSEVCPYATLTGGAKTGPECMLATHSVVAPKKVLGARVRLSAGAMALHNLPDDALLAAAPSKKMRTIHLAK